MLVSPCDFVFRIDRGPRYLTRGVLTSRTADWTQGQQHAHGIRAVLDVCIWTTISFTYAVLLRYCTRLQSPSFWGGEVEILILSKMLKAPIFVFQRAEEAGRYDIVVSF